jgi:Phage-integrase repeat unit
MKCLQQASSRHIYLETKTMKEQQELPSSPTAVVYAFKDARRLARSYGFESKQEFLDYSWPGGVYQLPKNPEEVWARDWHSWADFLGITLDFHEGRRVAHKLGVSSQNEYMEVIHAFSTNTIMTDSPPSSPRSMRKVVNSEASSLPYRPDLLYKNEWKGWDDWLGVTPTGISSAGVHMLDSCHHAKTVSWGDAPQMPN